MGANALGARKVRAIAEATGLDVVRASVWSHNDSGRLAHLRTADGRCWWYDRHTSVVERHGNCPEDSVAGDYDVASAEARAGRRGLLDSGPHAPERKGKGVCSGWADEEDYGPRYT